MSDKVLNYDVKQLRDFYNNQSVQTNNKFICIFEDDLAGRNELYKDIGPMPDIEFRHVESVSFDPNYTFESTSDFMYSVPSGDITFKTTKEIEVVLIEDRFNTVKRFIHWCQAKIISRGGFFRSQKVNRISRLRVFHVNEKFNVLNEYLIQGLYFKKADGGVSLKNGEAEIVKYTVTFASDDIERVDDKSINDGSADKPNLSNTYTFIDNI